MPTTFCVLIWSSACALWAEGEHYHYVVCNAFQSAADLTKIEKYASFATVISIFVKLVRLNLGGGALIAKP